jgi:dipeptidyl aminopeptidase/acylaminoacyl peptidase
MENVRALDDKLAAAGVAHTFHIYPNLGHGFLKAFLEEENVPGHDAACESWKRTLDFWRTHLGEPLEGIEEWEHGKGPHHHDAGHR